MFVGNHDWGEVVVNIGKARPKVIVASIALPKNLFAPRAPIFRPLNKKSDISDHFLELILLVSKIRLRCCQLCQFDHNFVWFLTFGLKFISIDM